MKPKEILNRFTQNYPLLAELYNLYEEIPKKDKALASALEINILDTLELAVVMNRQKKSQKLASAEQIQKKLVAICVYFILAKEKHDFNASDAVKSLEKIEAMLKKLIK